MLSFQVISLPGLKSFSEVHALQLELLEKRIKNLIPDTLIFCEHTPVITRGRGLQWRSDRSERAKPLLAIPEGTEYVEIERGGDLTWHGPGQLVMYPIVKLGGEARLGKKVGQDVDRFIRLLENNLIQILNNYGVESQSKVGGSGVWIGERKVMSVGIALRKWVNFHGIAINVVNDLSPFFAFDPCGYGAEVMTKLQDLPSLPPECFDLNWRSTWEKLYLTEFQKNID